MRFKKHDCMISVFVFCLTDLCTYLLIEKLLLYKILKQIVTLAILSNDAALPIPWSANSLIWNTGLRDYPEKIRNNLSHNLYWCLIAKDWSHRFSQLQFFLLRILSDITRVSLIITSMLFYLCPVSICFTQKSPT